MLRISNIFTKLTVEYIHKNDFPNGLSYNRFVELMPRLFIAFNVVLHMLFGEETGTYFIDATAIKVCHNKRRYRNKIFARASQARQVINGIFLRI